MLDWGCVYSSLAAINLQPIGTAARKIDGSFTMIMGHAGPNAIKICPWNRGVSPIHNTTSAFLTWL